jgi:hypothetical protein
MAVSSIDRLSVFDARYPLPPGAERCCPFGSRVLSGGDAAWLNCAWLCGTGFALTLGEGNRLACEAIEMLSRPLRGQPIEDLMAEFCGCRPEHGRRSNVALAGAKQRRHSLSAVASSEYGLIPQDTPALLPNCWTALPWHEVMESCCRETIFMHRFSTAIRLESCNPQVTASEFRCCTRVPRVAYSALYG